MNIRIRKIGGPLLPWEFPVLTMLTSPGNSAPVVIEQWDESTGAWIPVEIVN